MSFKVCSYCQEIAPFHADSCPCKEDDPMPVNPMQAHEFLEAGLGHMKDRAATYDAPAGERSMGKTVAMFQALTGVEMTEEQGWKFMCCLKMVRSEQGAFRADNFEDLAAYAGLAGEAASRADKAKT